MREIWAGGVGEGSSRELKQLEQGPECGKVWGVLGRSHWFWLEYKASREVTVVGGLLGALEGELPTGKERTILARRRQSEMVAGAKHLSLSGTPLLQLAV